MALRAVGYFSEHAGDRRRDVREFVDLTWEPQRRQRIAIYLRAATIFEDHGTRSRCPLCGTPVGTRDLTDGNWLWPEGLSHLVEHHAVRLPDDMVAHMEKKLFRVPKVDVKFLKLEATGLLDNPEAQKAPATEAKGRPGSSASDLEDATAAVPSEQEWSAAVEGIDTPTKLTQFKEAITVGREKRMARIVIPHGSVSRRHCRLVPGTDSVIVQDLDSQNGVIVKGQKVTQAELRDGDSFTAGPARITVTRVRR